MDSTQALLERTEELSSWLATLAEALKGDAAQAMVDGRLTIESLLRQLAMKDEALRTASWLLADVSPNGLVKKRVDAALDARGVESGPTDCHETACSTEAADALEHLTRQLAMTREALRVLSGAASDHLTGFVGPEYLDAAIKRADAALKDANEQEIG